MSFKCKFCGKGLKTASSKWNHEASRPGYCLATAPAATPVAAPTAALVAAPQLQRVGGKRVCSLPDDDDDEVNQRALRIRKREEEDSFDLYSFLAAQQQAVPPPDDFTGFDASLNALVASCAKVRASDVSDAAKVARIEFLCENFSMDWYERSYLSDKRAKRNNQIEESIAKSLKIAKVAFNQLQITPRQVEIANFGVSFNNVDAIKHEIDFVKIYLMFLNAQYDCLKLRPSDLLLEIENYLLVFRRAPSYKFPDIVDVNDVTTK